MFDQLEFKPAQQFRQASNGSFRGLFTIWRIQREIGAGSSLLSGSPLRSSPRPATGNAGMPLEMQNSRTIPGGIAYFADFGLDERAEVQRNATVFAGFSVKLRKPNEFAGATAGELAARVLLIGQFR